MSKGWGQVTSDAAVGARHTIEPEHQRLHKLVLQTATMTWNFKAQFLYIKNKDVHLLQSQLRFRSAARSEAEVVPRVALGGYEMRKRSALHEIYVPVLQMTESAAGGLQQTECA